jgi:UDP-MurNAc hydroxylase
VIYQLAIVFPNETVQYFMNFSKPDAIAESGYNPLANLFTTITASSLYGLINNIKGWDYAHLGGNCCTFKKVYNVSSHGIIRPEDEQINGIFELRFPGNELFEQVRNSEVDMYKQEFDDSINKSRFVMIEMGNTLIRMAKPNNTQEDNKLTRELQMLR